MKTTRRLACTLVGLALACGANKKSGFDDVPGDASGGGPGDQPGLAFDAGGDSPPGECVTCTPDGSQVITCDGKVLQTCDPSLRCGAGTCLPPCDAAAANISSVGCEYRPMALYAGGAGFGGCFV